MAQVSSMEHYRKKKQRAGNVRWFRLALFFLVCALAGYLLAQSPIFNLRHIEVVGNDTLTAEQVIAHTGLEYGQHIYEVNLGLIENLIKTDPWVDQVSVKRKLPSTIEITVTERVAVAMVQTAYGLLQVDKDGYVLKAQRLVDGMPLMLITGVSDIPEGVLPGQKIESESLQQGLNVIALMNEEAASVISELDVTTPQKIIAQNIYGVEWRIGDGSDFLRKFEICKQITLSEEEAGRLGLVAYIDASLPDKPTMAYNN